MNRTRTIFFAGMAAGMVVCALLSSWINSPAAQAQTSSLNGARGAVSDPVQGGNMSIALDERKMELYYANGFQVYSTNEEIISDLGVNLPNVRRISKDDPAMLFDCRARVVMTFASAKRYSDLLNRALAQIEQTMGPISTPSRGNPNPTPVPQLGR